MKGASAAAIYGTRANAGVIIITTKKGKAGKAKFNLKGIGTQTGVQAIGGGTGEALAQVASGEEIQPGEVLIEALAEGVSAPVDVAAAHVEEDNDDALIPAVQQQLDLEDGVESKQRPANLSLKVKGNVHIEGDSKTGQTLKINSEAGTAIDINNGTVWIDDSGEAMFKTGTSGKTLSARFVEANQKPKPFIYRHISSFLGITYF